MGESGHSTESGTTSPKPSLRLDRTALEKAVLLEQIRVLYRTPALELVNLVNASLVAFVLRDLFPVSLFVGWIGLFCIVIPARFLDRWHFLRAPQQAELAASWGWRFAVGATLTGCLWGLTGSVILMTPDPAYHAFIAFVIGGMMAGAVAGDSAFLPALIGFSATAALPLIFAFFARADPMSMTMGFMVTVFTAMLGIVGVRANHWIATIARREIIQRALAADLENRIEQLKDANTIVERSPTILFRLRGDPSLPLTYISHNVAMYGYDQAEMIASPQFYQTIIHPDDKLKIVELMAQVVLGGIQPTTVEFRMRARDGTYRWLESHYTPLRDAVGRLLEIEGILTDITEKKDTAEKIMVLVRTDALTGLANRATFIDRLRQTFAATKRGANPFAVLYLDLDRFKDVNDTLGHVAGDLLLKSVAERLKGCTRETDLVARLGGDEFAILQADLVDLANAGALASKIHDALAAPYPLGDTEMHISASIGISPYLSETADSDEMLAQADLALYRAKDEGRDQYFFHTEDLDREVRDRLALANDLRHALEHDELELHYQPQVELATGRIVGMEALIRWNHPTRGLIKPGDFLPIVEKTPLIVTLGQWVLDHACEQMNAWREAGIAPPILAINLALWQLRTGDELVGSITQTLTKWGLSPSDLELDVTESMLAHVTLHKNSVLHRLQQLGVKIAIDDFGTQYSSLDYLKTYRVNRVKISRPMLDAATQDPGASAMVRAIFGVARELDIEVIVQGVETEAQRDLLACGPSTTKVQGFYYSAPVPAVHATEMLRQRLIEPCLSQVSGAVAA
jgi:diguanylate cyclase (GGDEF)-like protein/PAS domain S-box-containing protein